MQELFPNQHSSDLSFLARICTKVLLIPVLPFKYGTHIPELCTSQYYSDTNKPRWILRCANMVCILVQDLHCVSSLKDISRTDQKICPIPTQCFSIQKDRASNWSGLFLPGLTLVQIISYISFWPSSALACDGDAEKLLIIKTLKDLLQFR